jgi:hypothetical protein
VRSSVVSIPAEVSENMIIYKLCLLLCHQCAELVNLALSTHDRRNRNNNRLGPLYFQHASAHINGVHYSVFLSQTIEILNVYVAYFMTLSIETIG